MNYLDDFLNHIQLKNSNSKHTYSSYKRDLMRFFSYLQEQDLKVEEVNKQWMIDYSYDLKKKKDEKGHLLSDKTYARHI
ncbi:MAG: site-specific integrase [Erysipelotrichaceae bacterium]